MKFSIVMVSYNSGEKLLATLKSVALQTCTDYEVIVKDSGSTDGSTDYLKRILNGCTELEHNADNSEESLGKSSEKTYLAEKEEFLESLSGRIRFFEGEDAGIYDAMNQAVELARGEYFLFLNCGDTLVDETVLAKTAEAAGAAEGEGKKLVLYGDTVSRKTGATIISPHRITGFVCYRNIPCHQSCFFSAALCREKPFELQYKIRADYDLFLRCFYQEGAEFVSMGFPVSSSGDRGHTESEENAERDRQEHRQITSRYMSAGALLGYRGVMALTLMSPHRRLAESKKFSGAYHWLKETVYRRKIWIFAAILLFLAEIALFIWPVGWMGKEETSYHTGTGSWPLEMTDGESGICQEFIPIYRNLKSVSILFGRESGFGGGQCPDCDQRCGKRGHILQRDSL